MNCRRTVRAKRLYKIKKNLNNDYVTFSCVHRHTHTHTLIYAIGKRAHWMFYFVNVVMGVEFDCNL